VPESLDELQKAAVAEVVHSEGTQFPAGRFQAKYGRRPSWGSLNTYRRDERPTALRFFFYGSEGGDGIMPDDVKDRLKAFVPPPAPAKVTSLERLLEDVADRGARVHDRGLARLIECADPALAALIARDPRTRRHCMRAGERHLVVPASSEATFRRALRELGYLLASGETRVPTGRRESARRTGSAVGVGARRQPFELMMPIAVLHCAPA
jgi:hypothetical protein